MTMEIIYVLFIQQLFIIKIQGTQLCSYYDQNGTLLSTSCSDDCCARIATSVQTACCSSVSWSSLAIPFFIIAGVCILAICLIYCRPLLKVCFCTHKCPCGNRSRVTSPDSVPPNDNPVYIMNNDDLPDYETIIKDRSMKDITPPPYNFVTAHPHDFNIEARVPSAPPQYYSRRSSLVTPSPPVES